MWQHPPFLMCPLKNNKFMTPLVGVTQLVSPYCFTTCFTPSTKFLGLHITKDLTWTTNTMSIFKKAQQRLHFLRRLKRASLPPHQAVRALNSTHTTPLWNPIQTPYLLKHFEFLCNSKCATHRWVGLYKPVVTHSPLFALDTFTHYCVYIIPQKTHKNIQYVCLHAHSLQLTSHCSPASCLNVSLFAHVQYLRGICTVVQFAFSLFMYR